MTGICLSKYIYKHDIATSTRAMLNTEYQIYANLMIQHQRDLIKQLILHSSQFEICHLGLPPIGLKIVDHHVLLPQLGWIKPYNSVIQITVKLVMIMTRQLKLSTNSVGSNSCNFTLVNIDHKVSPTDHDNPSLDGTLFWLP